MSINEINELLMKYSEYFKASEKSLLVWLGITLVVAILLCVIEERSRNLDSSWIPAVFAFMLFLGGPVSIFYADYFAPIPENAPSRDYLVEKCEFEYQGRVVKNQCFVSGLEEIEY